MTNSLTRSGGKVLSPFPLLEDTSSRLGAGVGMGLMVAWLNRWQDDFDERKWTGEGSGIGGGEQPVSEGKGKEKA